MIQLYIIKPQSILFFFVYFTLIVPLPLFAIEEMQRSGLVFEEDFNSGNDFSAMGLKHKGNATAEIVEENFLGTSPAVKISLNRWEDKVPFRTELLPVNLPSSDFVNGKNALFDTVYWYGIRIFLPADFEFDTLEEVVMQWHGKPDSEFDEQPRSPPLALTIGGDDDGLKTNYIIAIVADTNKVTPAKGKTRKRYTRSDKYDIGPIIADLGKWTQWIFKVKWSYTGNGLLKVWKDGEVVFEENNKTNAFNDDLGPNFKFGIYKWPWKKSKPGKISSRTIYFDDLRIGNERTDYDDMALSPQ